MKIMKKEKKENKNKHGFAMLFSVLISSILVIIGLSIFRIVLKELTISTAGRESQQAFYAANSGLECALYWDLKRNAFATSSSDIEIARAASIPASCGGKIVNASGNVSSQGTDTTTEFDFDINSPGESCATVSVKKWTDGTKLKTEIQSQGKNICAAEGRRVERGLEANYDRDI